MERVRHHEDGVATPQQRTGVETLYPAPLAMGPAVAQDHHGRMGVGGRSVKMPDGPVRLLIGERMEGRELDPGGPDAAGGRLLGQADRGGRAVGRKKCLRRVERGSPEKERAE